MHRCGKRTSVQPFGERLPNPGTLQPAARTLPDMTESTLAATRRTAHETLLRQSVTSSHAEPISFHIGSSLFSAANAKNFADPGAGEPDYSQLRDPEVVAGVAVRTQYELGPIGRHYAGEIQAAVVAAAEAAHKA